MLLFVLFDALVKVIAAFSADVYVQGRCSRGCYSNRVGDSALCCSFSR